MRFTCWQEAMIYLKSHGFVFGSQPTINALTIETPRDVGIKLWGAVDYLVNLVLENTKKEVVISMRWE